MSKTTLTLTIDTETSVVRASTTWPPGEERRSAPPALTAEQRLLAIRLAHEALGTKPGQLAAVDTPHGLELRRGVPGV
jgi:hypothetical protein